MYSGTSGVREISNDGDDGSKCNILKLKDFSITFQINIYKSTNENNWVLLEEVNLESTVSRV